MDTNFKTITVAELLERLADEDPDALVIFSADYGDRHHTRQALPIAGEVDTVIIERNAYSNSGFAILENDDDPESDQTYLLIS